MGMPKSFKTVEIEQQTRFGWTVDVVNATLNNWSVIQDFAYIVHDKDIKDDGVPKEPHIHVMIRFTGAVPTDAILARVKAVTGRNDIIKYEHLNKCHKWVSAVAYLTHENVQGKHIYDRSEVVSNYNFEDDIEKAMTGHVKLNKLLEEIANGEVKPYNINEHCTVSEYALWRTKIDSAFNYRANILLNRGDRDMKCIYIQGGSGVGKTSYAKSLCREREYSFFVSSGSNDVLDGYGGQDAIILDDLRPSALSLADLLKMLDNNTNSSVKSRYRNKVLECRLIIITTVLDIDTFFREVFKEQPETATQLRRRCETLIKMDADTMQVSLYNKELDTYISAPKIPNPMASLSLEKSVEVLANSLRETLRGTVPDAMLETVVQGIIDKSKTQTDKTAGFVQSTPANNPFASPVKVLPGQHSLFDMDVDT